MILTSLNNKLRILEKELGIYKYKPTILHKCDNDDDICKGDICFRCGETDCTGNCY